MNVKRTENKLKLFVGIVGTSDGKTILKIQLSKLLIVRTERWRWHANQSTTKNDTDDEKRVQTENWKIFEFLKSCWKWNETTHSFSAAIHQIDRKRFSPLWRCRNVFRRKSFLHFAYRRFQITFLPLFFIASMFSCVCVCLCARARAIITLIHQQNVFSILSNVETPAVGTFCDDGIATLPTWMMSTVHEHTSTHRFRSMKCSRHGKHASHSIQLVAGASHDVHSIETKR